MLRTPLAVLIIFLALAACNSFVPYSTVEKLTEPPSRTIVTHIKGQELSDPAGKNIHDYMNRLAVKVQTGEGITLVPYQQGFYVSILSSLWFGDQSHTMRNSTSCDQVLKVLQNTQYAHYLIEVHTHDEGSRYYNQALSERRLETLKNHLQEMGFPMDRTVFKAYGEDQPVADNSTTWGKQFNQRVEIAVVAHDNLRNQASKGPVFE